ncbi:DNA-binding response regulator [Pseudonocardia sp. TMWB2A]|uniref:response regulator transcription factor n=1 Tax=Pseudonocardia sp. TMWB2A TaxID=687430 RepID=UPI00307D1A3C
MRIAIADDDNTMSDYIAGIVKDQGYNSQTFANGDHLLTALRRDTYDLVMLDWNMPGKSGIETLEVIRDTMDEAPPVIMLTSRADKRDIATALQAGADDYIVKPEVPEIIAARMAAVLRRTVKVDPSVRVEDIGPYTFDYINRTIRVKGEEVILTAKEYSLALMFFRNLNRALSRSYLLQTLWNSVADLPTRTLDMHVSRIRSKLELTAENGYRVQTVFGYGYRLECLTEESLN